MRSDGLAKPLSRVPLCLNERPTEQVHCIEFPSILLPPGCGTGSVVTISCSRNLREERSRSDEFWDLQDDILSSLGTRSPSPPSLRLRNVTQTSVTLEWDRLDLATSKLLSLTIWRNGQRLAAIPNPLNNTSTKLSGLDVDANYSFHLILKTTAGSFASQTIRTRTLTLSDTSGIAVCFGTIDEEDLEVEAKEALREMRARPWSDRIQIETTHFVCTHPPNSSSASHSTSSRSAAGAGVGSGSSGDQPNPVIEYQRAVQLSIPIVQPSWILACLKEKKMVPISAHYLGKDVPPSTRSSANLNKGMSRTPSSTASVSQQPVQSAPAPAPAPAAAPVAAAEPQEEVTVLNPSPAGGIIPETTPEPATRTTVEPQVEKGNEVAGEVETPAEVASVPQKTKGKVQEGDEAGLPELSTSVPEVQGEEEEKSISTKPEQEAKKSVELVDEHKHEQESVTNTEEVEEAEQPSSVVETDQHGGEVEEATSKEEVEEKEDDTEERFESMEDVTL